MQYGKSEEGPWQTASLREIAELIEQAGELADPDNGVVLFIRVGNESGQRVFQVQDVRAIHGEDAMTRFSIHEEEGDDFDTPDEPLDGGFDDAASLLREIAAIEK